MKNDVIEKYLHFFEKSLPGMIRHISPVAEKMIEDIEKMEKDFLKKQKRVKEKLQGSVRKSSNFSQYDFL